MSALTSAGLEPAVGYPSKPCSRPRKAERWCDCQTPGEVGGVSRRLRKPYCTSCRRRFVEVNRSGQFFAAYPGAVDYEPLAPEVSEQWLREPCPGRELRDSAAYARRSRLAKAG